MKQEMEFVCVIMVVPGVTESTHRGRAHGLIDIEVSRYRRCVEEEEEEEEEFT